VRFAALPRMAALAALTRAFVEERLAPHAPVEIHRYLPPVELARRLGEVQREYSSSDDVKRAWCALFEDVGLDPADTARDRLVLRFQVHSDRDAALPSARSTATVGFHRDSWGTNLPAQVNWWAPVWPITAERTFAIYPGLWDAAVPNDSESFDLADVMERVRCAPETLAAGALAPRPTGPVDPGGGVPVVLAPGGHRLLERACARRNCESHGLHPHFARDPYRLHRGRPRRTGGAERRWPVALGGARAVSTAERRGPDERAAGRRSIGRAGRLVMRRA
jgi:hypothetical protein